MSIATRHNPLEDRGKRTNLQHIQDSLQFILKEVDLKGQAHRENGYRNIQRAFQTFQSLCTASKLHCEEYMDAVSVSCKAIFEEPDTLKRIALLEEKLCETNNAQHALKLEEELQELYAKRPNLQANKEAAFTNRNLALQKIIQSAKSSHSSYNPELEKKLEASLSKQLELKTARENTLSRLSQDDSTSNALSIKALEKELQGIETTINKICEGLPLRRLEKVLLKKSEHEKKLDLLLLQNLPSDLATINFLQEQILKLGTDVNKIYEAVPLPHLITLIKENEIKLIELHKTFLEIQDASEEIALALRRLQVKINRRYQNESLPDADYQQLFAKLSKLAGLLHYKYSKKILEQIFILYTEIGTLVEAPPRFLDDELQAPFEKETQQTVEVTPVGKSIVAPPKEVVISTVSHTAPLSITSTTPPPLLSHPETITVQIPEEKMYVEMHSFKRILMEAEGIISQVGNEMEYKIAAAKTKIEALEIEEKALISLKADISQEVAKKAANQATNTASDQHMLEKKIASNKKTQLGIQDSLKSIPADIDKLNDDYQWEKLTKAERDKKIKSLQDQQALLETSLKELIKETANLEKELASKISPKKSLKITEEDVLRKKLENTINKINELATMAKQAHQSKNILVENAKILNITHENLRSLTKKIFTLINEDEDFYSSNPAILNDLHESFKVFQLSTKNFDLNKVNSISDYTKELDEEIDDANDAIKQYIAKKDKPLGSPYHQSYPRLSFNATHGSPNATPFNAIEEDDSISDQRFLLDSKNPDDTTTAADEEVETYIPPNFHTGEKKSAETKETDISELNAEPESEEKDYVLTGFQDKPGLMFVPVLTLFCDGLEDFLHQDESLKKYLNHFPLANMKTEHDKQIILDYISQKKLKFSEKTKLQAYVEVCYLQSQQLELFTHEVADTKIFVKRPPIHVLIGEKAYVRIENEHSTLTRSYNFEEKQQIQFKIATPTPNLSQPDFNTMNYLQLKKWAEHSTNALKNAILPPPPTVKIIGAPIPPSRWDIMKSFCKNYKKSIGFFTGTLIGVGVDVFWPTALDFVSTYIDSTIGASAIIVTSAGVVTSAMIAIIDTCHSRCTKPRKLVSVKISEQRIAMQPLLQNNTDSVIDIPEENLAEQKINSQSGNSTNILTKMSHHRSSSETQEYKELETSETQQKSSTENDNPFLNKPVKKPTNIRSLFFDDEADSKHTADLEMQELSKINSKTSLLSNNPFLNSN